MVSLAGLNLHCGLDRHGRPYPVERAIASLDTDVVLVQENWRPAGGISVAAAAARACGYRILELDLVTGIPLAGLRIVRGPVPDETGAFGLAVLSRLPWHSHTTIGLGAAGGDVVGARSAQAVQVELPTGGTLRLANAHLTHRLAYGPQQLARLLRGLSGSTVPTVIAGDLNMCRPTIHLARGYRPAVRGRTWPAHRPVAQIDHVLTGPGVTAVRAGVGPATGSDHLPVRARLTVVQPLSRSQTSAVSAT